MCIPGLFLKKPESQKEDTSLKKEPEKSDNVIKVLKESFAHKGFRLLVLVFLFVDFKLRWSQLMSQDMFRIEDSMIGQDLQFYH